MEFLGQRFACLNVDTCCQCSAFQRASAGVNGGRERMCIFLCTCQYLVLPAFSFFDRILVILLRLLTLHSTMWMTSKCTSPVQRWRRALEFTLWIRLFDTSTQIPRRYLQVSMFETKALSLPSGLHICFMFDFPSQLMATPPSQLLRTKASMPSLTHLSDVTSSPLLPHGPSHLHLSPGLLGESPNRLSYFLESLVSAWKPE